jgi:hypothetical protein
MAIQANYTVSPSTLRFLNSAASVEIGSIDNNGVLRVTGGLVTQGYDAQGANIRMAYANYAAMFRVDTTNLYVLLTPSGGASGTWNNLRPITINLATGGLTLDSTGAGANFGGLVTIPTLNVTNFTQSGGQINLTNGGYTAIMRADATNAWVGFINQAGNAWNMDISDAGNVNIRGNLTISGAQFAVQGAVMGTDGNINGSVWGGWLSTWLNGKANNGAQVQWQSANVSWGPLQNINEVSQPYIVTGVYSNNGNSTANNIYVWGRTMRNQ